MSSQQHTGFKLGRLRFLRPPPSWVQLRTPTAKQPSSVQVELAIGLTDDYGVQLDSFDSLEVRLAAVDSATSQPLKNLTITPSDFTLRPSQSPFHTIKATLAATRSAAALPKTFRLLLSVASEGKGKAVAEGERDDEWIKQVIGEIGQEEAENWDEDRFVFLRALSGEVEVRETRAGENAVADTKVQTILRTIHLPQPALPCPSPATSATPPPQSAPPLSSVRIVERPGLNNSTGQRLWDCAIGLTAYLSRNPEALWPSLATTSSPTEQATKRLKHWRALQVIELGAGCGLVGIAAARLLSGAGVAAEVMCTDVEATVTTTLQETLDFNASPTSSTLHPSARTLNWGTYSPTELNKALLTASASSATRTAPDRTLLGSDILYNPESHAVLLETLLSFLRPDGQVGQGHTKCLIAYKARTEGDDGFFELARGKGLEVGEVWRWGQVSVWEFR